MSVIQGHLPLLLGQGWRAGMARRTSQDTHLISQNSMCLAQPWSHSGDTGHQAALSCPKLPHIHGASHLAEFLTAGSVGALDSEPVQTERKWQLHKSLAGTASGPGGSRRSLGAVSAPPYSPAPACGAETGGLRPSRPEAEKCGGALVRESMEQGPCRRGSLRRDSAWRQARAGICLLGVYGASRREQLTSGARGRMAGLHCSQQPQRPHGSWGGPARPSQPGARGSGTCLPAPGVD